MSKISLAKHFFGSEMVLATWKQKKSYMFVLKCFFCNWSIPFFYWTRAMHVLSNSLESKFKTWKLSLTTFFAPLKKIWIFHMFRSSCMPNFQDPVFISNFLGSTDSLKYSALGDLVTPNIVHHHPYYLCGNILFKYWHR